MISRTQTLLLGALCLLPAAALASGTPAVSLQPFSATYKVLRKGSSLGTSTLSLHRNDDGSWTYRSRLKAESGLAALLGGSVEESSRFRLHDGHIESLDYDYHLHAAIKDKRRKVRVDWKTGKVTVHTSDDGDFTYKTTPGLVERHLLLLALGRAMDSGKSRLALPVAVKDRVQTQTFAVKGKQGVKVPAGRFDAVRVVRTHDDKGYTAWFAPERYGTIPVKLSQGSITLLLESVQKQP